jgi:glycosyltransferase involved in cell wall biosynthesis
MWPGGIRAARGISRPLPGKIDVVQSTLFLRLIERSWRIPSMASLVSVIIPAYNGGQRVERAIASVLNQTLPVHEVIVVDDGSTDDTVEVVSRFGAPVRVVSKTNGGPASARNLGASLACGEWLAMLDADDWWFPRKNEIQLAHAAADNIGLSHCRLDHRIERPPHELTFDDLWERNWIGNSSVLIRRAVFETLGGFVEERRLISVEDYNLWLRVSAASWRVVTCPHILVHYTQGIGISSNPDRLMRASLYNVDDLEQRLPLSPEVANLKRKQIRSEFRRLALHESENKSARSVLRQIFREEPGVGNGLHMLAGTLFAPALRVKQTLGQKMRRGQAALVTLEDAQESEFAERRIPVEETPFWSETGHAVPVRDSTLHMPAAALSSPAPMLVTTIDAEEDFDWNGPFIRTASRVTSMRSQHKAHRVFERYGVVPTYLVDFPVASQDEGRGPLRELLESRQCEIGAQLHPWVTPPFVEVISNRNSYPGNLPMVVEYDKLLALTNMLEEGFGIRPRIYRAGRYGFGPNTGEILRHLGYLVDTSVMPCWNYTPQGGPDFRALRAQPYWIDRERTVLEMPISVALVGRAARLGPFVSSGLFTRLSEGLGFTAAVARLGLIERIRLTPEGIAIDEAKRLVRQMIADGQRVFVLTYHSPSMEPGGTPYVRTAEDLTRFLRWLEEFYDFFTKEISGLCVSWRDVRDALLPVRAGVGRPMMAPAA